MATAGPLYAGTAANSNDGGTTAWSNPTNAEGDTTSTAATCNIGSNGGTSQLLRTTNFGFSIPDGATIDGVTIEAERSAANNSRHRWDAIRLLVSGSESGDTKGTNDTINTTKQFSSYGGAADLWGLSLTPAIVNATGFGVSLKINRNSAQATTTSIFRVRITVDYHEAAVEESGTDDGSGTDSVGLSVALTPVDTGGGADAAAATAAIVATDTATATDTADLDTDAETDPADTDNATGTDVAALAAVVAGTDAGDGTDVAALGAAVAATDSAAGTDTPTLAAGSSPGETAAGTDVAAVAASAATTDTAGGTDAVAIAALYAASDTGVGELLAALTVHVVATDGAVGTDASTLQTPEGQAVDDADLAAGADAATLVTLVVATDVGSGVDTASGAALLAVSETGVGADLSAIVAAIAALDHGDADARAVLGGAGLPANLATMVAITPGLRASGAISGEFDVEVRLR